MSYPIPIANISPNFRSFRSCGRRYLFGHEELQSLQLLCQLYEARNRCDDGLWAVRSRPILKRLVELDAKTFCNAAIENSRDPVMRRIAIWVRGHLGGYSGVQEIEFVLSSKGDVGTRRACVRTLARLHGFHLLRRLSEEELDRRVRELAFTLLLKQQPRSHAERLHQFTQLVRPLPTVTRERELRVDASLDWSQKRATKSVEFIRSILATIQSLVRLGRPANGR